jgi:protein-tyrosine-phosphatase
VSAHDPEKWVPVFGPDHAQKKYAVMARPRAVLFACQMNAVRSPMAAALLAQMFPAIRVASVGVAPGDLDPFAVAVMEEIGVDISKHRPIDFEEYEDLEGLDFGLIVTLSPGAHHKAISLSHRIAAEIEYWPTPDPTAIEGNREQRLDAYRAVRDELTRQIRERFAGSGSDT